MMEKIRHATCASVLGFAAVIAGNHAALASGFALREESAEGLGNAYAGQTAKAYNASTVFYNPAGMSRLTDDEVAGTVSWIAPVAKFTGSNSNPVGGKVGGSTNFDGIKDAAIGSLFGVYKLNPDWSVGLSVAAPFGMRSEYKEDWVGRYQALASDVTDVEFSPVLSYKIDNHWSVGGGPRVDYISARLTQAINSAALSGGFIQSDGEAKVTGDDTGVGYVLGALYQFDDKTRVGVNYRSRIHHELSGDVSYQVPTPLTSRFVNQGATAKITLPDSLNVGIYHELDDRWAAMADMSWTHWSVFQTLNVVGDNGAAVSSTNEKWHDTWFASLGLNYKPADQWVLHTGVAFDQAPVRTAYRTARIPDANRYWLSFGASYSIDPATDVHLGYTHIFTDSGTINETANAASGTLTGTYKSSVDIVSASFAIKF